MARPTYEMQVSVNGEPAVTVLAPVTVWTPSNDYTSGDYEAVVEDVTVCYSTCGTYVATYQGRREIRPVPRYGSGDTVMFDFAPFGGPRVEILSKKPHWW